MTTMMPVAPATSSVGAVLADVHEDWMREIADTLSPALSETADFWSRWTIARFLDDQFADHFRLERNLVVALAPLMAPGTAEGLAAAARSVERTATALIEAGRRRESRGLTARLTRRFIDGLALWCVEVEMATVELKEADLPPLAATELLRERFPQDSPLTWVYGIGFFAIGAALAAQSRGTTDYLAALAPRPLIASYTGLTNAILAVVAFAPVFGGLLIQRSSYETLFVAVLAIGLAAVFVGGALSTTPASTPDRGSPESVDFAVPRALPSGRS